MRPRTRCRVPSRPRSKNTSSESGIVGRYPLHAMEPIRTPIPIRRHQRKVVLCLAPLKGAQMVPNLRNRDRSVVSAIKGQRVVLGCDPYESWGDAVLSEPPRCEGSPTRVCGSWCGVMKECSVDCDAMG